MKKIFFLTNTFYPEYGAATNRLLHTALGLQEAGYKIEVITGIPHYPFGKFYKGYKRKFYQKQTYKGINIHRFWLFPSHNDALLHRVFTMFSLAFAVLLAMPFLKKKTPSYIFLQYPPVAMVFPALVLKKLTKAKLIVNVSDLWPVAIEELGFTSQKSFLYLFLKKLEQFTYKKADLLLAQSSEIKAYLETRNQNASVLLYRTAVDCEIFKPKVNNESRQKTIKVVYAGVLGVAHGIYRLCKMLEFPQENLEFHIYGDGFEKQKIERYLKKHPNKPIFLHSMVPQEKLVDLMQGADLVLISQKTRIYGTVPSKIYEALALAKPIIFHGAGEGAEIIRKADAGLVSHPNDFKQLNLNLALLANAQFSFRKKMGDRGRLSAINDFDRKIYVNNLIKTLKHLELGDVKPNKAETHAKDIYLR